MIESYNAGSRNIRPRFIGQLSPSGDALMQVNRRNLQGSLNAETAVAHDRSAQDLGAIEVSRSVTEHPPDILPPSAPSLALKLLRISAIINCRFKAKISVDTTKY